MAVFTVIKPKPLKAAAMRLELLGGMRKFGREVRPDFDATTKTWEGEKPNFISDVSLGKEGPVLFVGPDNDGSRGAQKYAWLNDGTPRHPIYAGIYTGRSTKRVLSFRGRFRPKTRPGYIGSFAGFSGGPREFRPYVDHPGIKARNFDEIIARKRYKLYQQRMAEAMAKAAKVSGHAI